MARHDISKVLEEFGEPIKNFRIPKFMIATSR